MRVHASFEEKLKLLELFDRTGRLGFVGFSSVDRELVNGLFTVVKDLEKDRLILDARPPN